MAEKFLAKINDPIVKAKMEQVFKAMSSINPQDILLDFRPFLVIHKDGHVQRFMGMDTVPPGPDPITGVDSKDVIIAKDAGVYVRVYKPPKLDSDDQKVPVLVYFHGGGFCIESPSSPGYHFHLNALASMANVVIVSVNYRLVPEFPLPIGYDDSWLAVEWVVSGHDQWLKSHADFSRVFFGGDSAGSNIAHNMAMRVGKIRKNNNIDNIVNTNKGFVLKGIVLIHPFFWGEDRIGSEEEKIKNGSSTGTGDKLWKFACPGSIGLNDPMINPEKDPELVDLGCEKVLVLVAEEDGLRDRGFHYKDCLVRCGWKGVAEVAEAIGEDHVFHLLNPDSATAVTLMSQVAAFLNSVD